MNKAEMDEFIEQMEEIGDVWQEEDVKRVYGECSLAEALDDRKSSIGIFADIIGKVINNREE